MIGYDEQGHTVYTKLGNGTETTYAYDRERQRLQEMNLTAGGNAVMQNKYRYDAVDNILGIVNIADPQGMKDFNAAKLGGACSHEYQYDELNRLIHATGKAKSATYDMAMTFNSMSMTLTKVQTSRYTYNHAGERVVKSHGTMEGVYINGAPQGITFHETDEYTIYPASIITVSKNRFTKHYFIGDKRVASRIGTGQFNNVYGQNGSYVTAGQQDYTERLNLIQSKKEDYYKELGIAPGVPTMKGAYGDPENTGVGYNTVITELGDHSVPEGWIQTPKRNTEPNTVPGTPVSWNDPIKPENPDAGYGFIPSDTADVEETFFFHSDHLGSTSYITDQDGNITQYDAYLPYGELLVDEHSSSEEMPYKFNGKELDEETGLYYYGARYMQPVASIWYGVDPLTEKYPEIGAYLYCHANPIKLIDPNGMDDYTTNTTDGSITVTHTQSSTHSFYLYNGDQTIKVGSYKYNEHNLIGMEGSVTFNNFNGQKTSISFNPKNKTENYISPLALAALIGATADVGADDVYVNHFSNSDGSSPPPSRSHKNGVNGDLRYFKTNHSANRGLITDKDFDEARQIKFVEALYKYGWSRTKYQMVSERYNGKLLPHTWSAKEHKIGSPHNNHLHLQGFSPKVNHEYYGGELNEIIITGKK